ncbi:MAG: hypothetical protein IPJ40_18295 [Saprospirales bacterium]|nr:hypothetical protein [Saprospirales bacterium]
MLALEAVNEGEPEMSGRLLLSKDYLALLLRGEKVAAPLQRQLPRQTDRNENGLEDLGPPASTFRDLEQIKNWLAHHPKLKQTLIWAPPETRLPGPVFGPPGTGKTLTANLLGKEYGKDVYGSISR